MLSLFFIIALNKCFFGYANINYSLNSCNLKFIILFGLTLYLFFLNSLKVIFNIV